MKILHLIDSGGLYGAEKMLLTLVAEQVSQGLEPMILSSGDFGIEEKAIEAEAKRLKLPIMSWRMNPGLNLKGIMRILSWAKSNGYRLMHSHGYKFNILTGIWPQAIRGIPVVSTLHGYVHAPAFTKMWLYELLDRFVLRRMDAVVLVNAAMWFEMGRGLRESRLLHVVPNGVDIAEIQREGEKKPDAQIERFLADYFPVVLGVGRLSREKGFDRLIDAFALIREDYPSAGLLIVGEGNSRNDLETLIRQHHLTNSVLLPGYCANVSALMARVQVLAIPSLTEGLPITLLEAMTLRLPIVATAVGAMPEVLDHGEGGWVVQLPDTQNFRNSIVECLDDSEQRDQKARKASEKVREAYSSEAMATSYNYIYQKVTS